MPPLLAGLVLEAAHNSFYKMAPVSLIGQPAHFYDDKVGMVASQYMATVSQGLTVTIDPTRGARSELGTPLGFHPFYVHQPESGRRPSQGVVVFHLIIYRVRLVPSSGGAVQVDDIYADRATSTGSMKC